MTVQYLKLGGEERPLLFAFAAFYEYEQSTGRNATADIVSLGQGEMSIMKIVDLAHAALVAGHRHEKKEIDFDVNNVAVWLSAESSIIEKIMTMMAESMPKETKGKKKAKKSPPKNGGF